MSKLCRLIARRIAPLAAAGMLLQAGSCTLDTAALSASLINSIASTLIGSIISSAFGVGF